MFNLMSRNPENMSQLLEHTDSDNIW